MRPLFKLLRFTDRRWLAVLVVGLFTFFSSCLLFQLTQPRPSIQDEFSYLLASDTFAHGRLSNPPLADKSAFESFHILVEPTYASKYPPAQGAAMALGQVAFGNPIVGVWLSWSLACAAICWMLQAWVPARWAFLLAMICSIKLTFFGRSFEFCDPVGYWSQSYFGGAMAALGGALVYGAIRRLLSGQVNFPNNVIFFSGIAILTFSRPAEGLVCSLPALAVLAKLFFDQLMAKRNFRQILIPGLLLFLLTTALQATINVAVTGKLLTMPYQLHHSKYSSMPVFLFQPLSPKINHSNPQLARFDRDNIETFKREHTFSGFWHYWWSHKAQPFWRFFLDVYLSIPLLFLPLVLKRPWMLLALGALGLELIFLSAETFFSPHYAAASTCLIYLLLAQCMRSMPYFKINSLRLGKILLSISLLGFLLASLCGLFSERRVDYNSWYYARANIMNEMAKTNDKHLIFVRYGPNHFYHHEWVYNEAAPESAKVIWAHEGNVAQNQAVAQRYKGRQLWLLIEDAPAGVNLRPILQKLN